MIPYVICHLLLMPILLVGVTILIFRMLPFLTPMQHSALYALVDPRVRLS